MSAEVSNIIKVDMEKIIDDRYRKNKNLDKDIEIDMDCYKESLEQFMKFISKLAIDGSVCVNTVTNEFIDTNSFLRDVGLLGIDRSETLCNCSLYYGHYIDFIDVYKQNIVHNFFKKAGYTVSSISNSKSNNDYRKHVSYDHSKNVFYHPVDRKNKVIDIIIQPPPNDSGDSLLLSHIKYIRKAFIRRYHDINENNVTYKTIIERLCMSVGGDIATKNAIEDIIGLKSCSSENEYPDEVIKYFNSNIVLKKEEVKSVIDAVEKWLVIENKSNKDVGGNRGITDQIRLHRIKIKEYLIWFILSDRHSGFTRNIAKSNFVQLNTDVVKLAYKSCCSDGIDLSELGAVKKDKDYINILNNIKYNIQNIVNIPVINNIDQVLYIVNTNKLYKETDSDSDGCGIISDNIELLLERIITYHFMSKEDILKGNEIYVNIIFKTSQNMINPLIDDWLTGLSILNEIYKKYTKFLGINDSKDNILESSFIIFRTYTDYTSIQNDVVASNYLALNRFGCNMAFFSHVFKFYNIYLSLSSVIKDSDTLSSASAEVKKFLLNDYIKRYENCDSDFDATAMIYREGYISSHRPVLTSAFPLNVIMSSQVIDSSSSIDMIEDLRRYSEPPATANFNNRNEFLIEAPKFFTRWNSNGTSNSKWHKILSIDRESVFVGRMDGIYVGDTDNSKVLHKINMQVNNVNSPDYIVQMSIYEHIASTRAGKLENNKSIYVKINSLYGIDDKMIKVSIDNKTAKKTAKLDDIESPFYQMIGDVLTSFFSLNNKNKRDYLFNMILDEESLKPSKSIIKCISRSRKGAGSSDKTRVDIHDKFFEYRIFKESCTDGDAVNNESEKMEIFLNPGYVRSYAKLINLSLNAPYILPMSGCYQTMHYLAKDESVATLSQYNIFNYSVI